MRYPIDIYLTYDEYEFEGIGTIWGMFIELDEAIHSVKTEFYPRETIFFKKEDKTTWRAKLGPYSSIIIEKYTI